MPAVAPILANIAINLAIGVAASVLASALSPQTQSSATRISTQRGLTFDMEVGEAAAVSAILGRGRATGQLVYMNEYGANNEYTQMLVKIGHGWHDGMDSFLVDEKSVALSGSNSDPKGRSVDAYTISGTPYMWVKYYTGAPGQIADAELVANANPPTRWTSDHKMTGCAYMIVTIRYQEDLFGSTIPKFGSTWRGLRLFDWREEGAIWGDQSTYVFTENPAVIRYNFRRGIYVNGVKVLGQGFSAYANDLAGYTAAANRCDETFYDPESETTFPVFAFGRQIDDDEEKLSVLAELDASYAGSSFKRGGADVPLPAQQLTSVMTLANADRLETNPIRVNRKGSVSAKKTMWHGQFVSESLGWTSAPYEPRIDTDLESVIGGRRAETLDQPFETLQERAQLRAEIALRRQFYSGTRVETFAPKALVLEPGDPVTRVCEWGTLMMVVEKVDPLPDKSGVTLTLSEWSNTIVPTSGDSFVSLPVGPGAGAADADRTIAVSGLSMAAYSREGGGAVHACAKATWTQITDPNVEQVMFRVWPSAGTEANDKIDFFASARLQNSKISDPLSPLTEYTYKAIPIRSDARTCVWTNTATFTTGAEIAPAVAEGAVDLAQLSQELKNISGPVIGDVYATLSDFEERLGDLASVVMDAEMLSRERTTGISVRNATAAAAVIRNEKVAIEQGHILAQLDEQITVVYRDLSADGRLVISSVIDEETAEATISFAVRVNAGDNVGQSVLQLGAVADGIGGTSDSWIGAMADRFYFLSTSGELVGQPFAIEADFVKVTNLRFENMTSIDGVSIEIEGRGGTLDIPEPFIEVRSVA